jgi:hypothetical protein
MQRDQFADPRRVAAGHQDQRSIPVTVAADTPGSLHQGVDFTRHQVLPPPALSVGDPPRRACRLKLSHKGLERGKYAGDGRGNLQVIGVTRPDPDLFESHRFNIAN